MKKSGDHFGSCLGRFWGSFGVGDHFGSCTAVSFSVVDGDDRENVTFKMNSRFLQTLSPLFQIAENAKCGQMSPSWFLGDRTQV